MTDEKKTTLREVKAMLNALPDEMGHYEVGLRDRHRDYSCDAIQDVIISIKDQRIIIKG